MPVAELVRALAAGRPSADPALEQTGWWRRPERLLVPSPPRPLCLPLTPSRIEPMSSMGSHAKVFGHAAHPMLIVVPLGMFVGAEAFDARFYFGSRNPTWATSPTG